ACRPASAGTNQVRAGYQPEDRQGARPRSPANATRPRRRGDRMIGRREFLTLLGSGAAIAWPSAAQARSAAMTAGDFLDPRSADAISERLRGFRQGLKETGYIEGENIAIVYRYAENQIDRLPEMAADLVRG